MRVEALTSDEPRRTEEKTSVRSLNPESESRMAARPAAKLLSFGTG